MTHSLLAESARLKKLFAERLHRRRKSLGLSQNEFADAIAVHFTMVSHLENGKRLPSAFILRRICIKLRTSADYFLGLERRDLG